MEQYQNVEEEKLIIWLLVCPVKRERGNNKKGNNIRGSLELVCGKARLINLSILLTSDLCCMQAHLVL